MTGRPKGRVEAWLTPGRWIQGAYGDGIHTACLYTALVNCYPQKPWEQLDITRQAIRALYPDRISSGSIIRFNDHPSTTHADVIRVCKRAEVIRAALDYAREQVEADGRHPRRDLTVVCAWCEAERPEAERLTGPEVSRSASGTRGR